MATDKLTYRLTEAFDFGVVPAQEASITAAT